jgi:hypothetical protein
MDCSFAPINRAFIDAAKDMLKTGGKPTRRARPPD